MRPGELRQTTPAAAGCAAQRREIVAAGGVRWPVATGTTGTARVAGSRSGAGPGAPAASLDWTRNSYRRSRDVRRSQLFGERLATFDDRAVAIFC